MSADGHKPRPVIGGRGKLSIEQVRTYRAEFALRQRLLRQLAETRSISKMAAEAGINASAMEEVLRGRTYKWVRGRG